VAKRERIYLYYIDELPLMGLTCAAALLNRTWMSRETSAFANSNSLLFINSQNKECTEMNFVNHIILKVNLMRNFQAFLQRGCWIVFH
jgi:hypothetical protein